MENVDMIKVSSSNVESVGYKVTSRTLMVKFLNGSTYNYLGVPEIEFSRLLAADSVGKYLNTYIKGTYQYQKVG